MSSEYLAFVSVYVAILAIAAFVVLTDPGQGLILRMLEDVGARTGAGPWGFLQTFGPEPAMSAIPARQRVSLAEQYILSAHQQTLVAARVAFWVLVSGCVACVVAAAAIVGVLPRFVVTGAWTYEAYVHAAQLVVYGSAAGGLAMGLGLAWWLFQRVFRLNCSQGCAAARGIVSMAQHGGITDEVSLVLRSGSFPRLSRLVAHVR